MVIPDEPTIAATAAPDGNALVDRAWDLWTEATEIWVGGGWAMVAIALIAVAMFGVGVRVLLKLRAKGFRSVPERTWRRWIDHPAERSGKIGRMLDFATDGDESLERTTLLFEQLRVAESAPIERDLRVMTICVSAAPLVGLLGTVTGMLATFGALASGAGGDKTMGLVAKGISEALITTETGLVVALPGLFFQYQLGRTFETYKAFLTHLETVCTQTVYRRSRERRTELVHRTARQRVAAELHRRLRRPDAVSASMPVAATLPIAASAGQSESSRMTREEPNGTLS